MRRLSCDTCLGSISSHGFIKSEKLSWMWSGETDLQTNGQREVMGFKEGEGGGHKPRNVWSLEATLGKYMNSSHVEGTQPCQHRDFSPGRARSDF